MSEADMHAPFNGYSGRIGKLVYKQYKGRTIVSHVANPKRTLSAAEIALRAHFTEASQWAKLAFKNEELRAFYEDLAPKMVFIKKGVRKVGTTPHSAAVCDYLVAPSIKSLDVSEYNGQTGDNVSFLATDNVGVYYAQIKIDDADGNRLETGDPVMVDADKGSWVYTTTRTIPAGTNAKITVIVYDRPGNSAEVIEEKAL